jgi:carbon-monoxide dehydrogenase medium subunit
MIPAPFEYVRAKSLAEAIGFLVETPEDAKLLAGGHTLIPAMKLRLASPVLVVDIRSIDELKGIDIADNIRIGALTTHAELLTSQPLRQILPIFRDVATVIADPQVRNSGTIGGSLANADPAADWPAVILALDAELELAGPDGRRRVPAGEFFIDIMTTALQAQEVLVAVYIPRPDKNLYSCYRKIRHPASGYAVVAIAAAIQLSDGLVARANIGVTGAAAHAFTAHAASSYLIGKPLSEDNIRHAASLASDELPCLMDHYASADYRKHLVKTEVARALSF